MIKLRHRSEINKLISKPQTSGAWLARIGDGSGNVEVPGYPSLRYVRPVGSDLVLIVNKGPASNDEGARVWVGPDPYQRYITRILGLDASTNQQATGVEAHAPSHFRDGTDPLWLDQAQIVNLLATPSLLTVTVKAGWVIVAGKAVWIEKQTLDLTSNVPDTGALYALIRADQDGILDVQEGTPVDEFVDLTKADIPEVEAGYAQLWAVRLYAGQTAISWTTAAPDLVDLRLAANAGMAVGEEDDDPIGFFSEIKFPSGSLTDNGDGTISVDLSAAAGDNTLTGAYGDIPASDNAGDLYLPSDGVSIQRDTGAAWVPWGPIFPLTAPPTTGWSWDNQDTATVTDEKGGRYLYTPANAGTELYVLHRTAPSVPYVIDATFIPAMIANNYVALGLVFRQNSDGKIVAFTLTFEETQWIFRYQKWTSSTSFSAHYGYSYANMFPVIHMRIEDNNTNRICSYSFDGLHFIPVHTVGRTDFLTADQVGFCVKSQGSYPAGGFLISWKES